MRSRGADAAAIAAVGAAVLAYVGIRLWVQAPVGGGVGSADIYRAQWPMLHYFWLSLARGHGYLWNSLQSCGEPVVAMTPPGTLYPFNFVFLLFGLRLGFPAIAVLHLMIGGAGAYALCRQYAVGRVAALCGALAFTFSGSAVNLATWLPSANLGTFVWLPAAVCLLERLLKGPTLLCMLALAAVLGLQLLAGSPQIAFFTDQVIALRLCWALAARQVPRPWHVLGALVGAALLALGLAAVQLLPSLELSRQSLRGFQLSMGEIQPHGEIDWPAVRASLFSMIFVRDISLGAGALAIAAWAARRTRGLAAFYSLLAVVYVLLMWDTPLFRFYLHLPFGRTFRFPTRFSYVVTFAISVLAGLGADAILTARGQGQRWVSRSLPMVVLALGCAVYYQLALVPPSLWEMTCFAGLVLAAALAIMGRLGAANVILPVALAAAILGGILGPFLGFQKDPDLLTRRADAFEAVRGMMTPQDRVYQYETMPSYSIMPKSASLFDVRSIADYEPQIARRYAELWVRLVRNKDMRDVNSYYFASSRPLANRPLLNLLATRYILVGNEVTPFERWMRPPYRLRWEYDGVRIFENPDALPRAYFVPRLQVVRDPHALLQRLASPAHRPRDVALVDEPPADGFLGVMTGPPQLGDVVTIDDRDEVVRLEVAATGPGFVVLTDQFYPGWRAWVNGVPTPILRANYAFRVVRVPEGVSVVEFAYRPTSVRVGAFLSLTTTVVMCLGVAWSRGWLRW